MTAARPRPQRATPGTVTHDGRPMKYAHDQRAAYVLDRCRCDGCRAATTKVQREMRHQIAPAYVAADPARLHVRFLSEQGVGLKQIAKVSGVPQGTLWKLVYGKPGGQPSKRVRKDTLDRILAVMPSDVAAGSKIDATATWVLLDEMIAAGVPKARIAEHLGAKTRALQLSRSLITPRNARAVKDLHTAWVAGRVDLVRRDCHGNERVATPPTREPDYIDRSAVLLDLAEILEARNSEPWRADAACRNRPAWIWFPGRGDHRCIAKAKAICAACLVRGQCLSANYSQRDGIYGGLTAGERRERRRLELGTAS